jgi:hypothetical protein
VECEENNSEKLEFSGKKYRFPLTLALALFVGCGKSVSADLEEKVSAQFTPA